MKIQWRKGSLDLQKSRNFLQRNPIKYEFTDDKKYSTKFHRPPFFIASSLPIQLNWMKYAMVTTIKWAKFFSPSKPSKFLLLHSIKVFSRESRDGFWKFLQFFQSGAKIEENDNKGQRWYPGTKILTTNPRSPSHLTSFLPLISNWIVFYC